MRAEQPDDGQPTNRRARRSRGADRPRSGGRVVVNPRQYAMRRR
ncbi:hypothetical protein [Saccharothrix algeriensis]|uniref:Uncharacterized protein n=1 Tax=Saccharothrix algeriensis TaxID=173560 RepID=A0ABS2S394_9PSEU|nr:hypothetical protein [Saccharothrix algeriensis]MBM7810711.1 hypothetical protein [Saccharothrix algeriensis]